MAALPEFQRGHGIVGAVAASGIGEIVNEVDTDARRVVEHTAVKALLCAPLNVGERVIGIIVLGSTIPKSYTAAELKLLTTLALQTATAIENARLFERTIQAARERERLLALHEKAEVARAKLESELNLAARIQADLFPSQLPATVGYELAAHNRPARQCGGDYYDALCLTAETGATELLLCVADVSGKGLPAALVMSNMQATLRALLGRTPSLRRLASHASDLLFASTAPEKYVTAAFVQLAPVTGAITFVGAGHLDNVILRASGEIVPLTSTGAPLGLLGTGLPYDDTTHALECGDYLVLFSDGVTDATDEADEEFGEQRLFTILRESVGAPAKTLIDRVFTAIDAFAGGAPQFDDITLLVVRRLPAPTAPPSSGSAAVLPH
jgi:sigma-B regulation protein RsbU (phosphoserine phosphatase)